MIKESDTEQINRQYEEYIKKLTILEQHLKIPAVFDFDEDTLFELLNDVKNKDIKTEIVIF